MKPKLTPEAALAVLDGVIRALFGPDAGRYSPHWRPTAVRPKLGKWLVFFRLAFRDGPAGRLRWRSLVAKIYGADRGGVSFSALGALRAAGFGPPGRHRVPAAHGYFPALGVLIQDRAPGRPWADFLAAGPSQLATASARAADWLVQLKGCRPAIRPRDFTVERLGRFAQELLQAFGSRGRWVVVASEVMARVADPDGRLVPSHGDYHPKNVLLTPRLTTVVDFDTFGLREPAFDVGYAIGQLLIMSHFRTGSFSPGAGAALAFWHRYRGRGGTATWGRVTVHVARSFLESLHYELCVLRTGRMELLTRWAEQMDLWLHSSGPTTLEELGRMGGWAR